MLDGAAGAGSVPMALDGAGGSTRASGHVGSHSGVYSRLFHVTVTGFQEPRASKRAPRHKHVSGVGVKLLASQGLAHTRQRRGLPKAVAMGR